MIKENAFCHTDYRDGVLSALIEGEIDHHTAVGIREKIDGLLFRYRPEKLILDLCKVSFMDSSGLGLVLGRASLCQEIGAKVYLINANERTRKILSLAGVSRIENLVIEANKEKKK
ncbi:MAG: STAS domain-containing protein [Ruminococcaceae bacterium]|nr:STAS domain-containing protein [Oscillospiraceae bacterium]